MHPQRELTRLAARKAALIVELDRHRAELSASVARLLEPLELIDRSLALWRRVAPLAGSAAAMRPGDHVATARPTGLGAWLRWLPLVVSATRLVRNAAKLRTRRSDRGVH
ncbi:MAG TPA: hypothetical protein PK322_04300 [Opitutaceae bacterium]|nr:hypothetical protein [Opitutaceae bacterium]